MSGREIKFRFYSNIENKMYENMNLIGLNTTYDKNPCIYSANKVVVENGATRCQYLKDGHLMQFTELRDNKRTDEYPCGQEVYEGDIVEFIDLPDGDECLCVGKVILEDFGWHFTNSITESSLSCYDSDSVKVIGNIYENPEIIGEKV